MGKPLSTLGWRDGVTGVQELASLMAAGAIAGLSGWGWSLATAAVRDVIQGQEAD